MDTATLDPAARGWRIHDLPGFSGLAGPFWFRETGPQGGTHYAFQAEPRHLNNHGIVHGGMLMTFIDQAIGVVVWEAIGRRPCSTVQLGIQFVAPGKEGDFVEAQAWTVRQTRSLVFMRGTLTAGDRTLLTADGIWKVLGA